MTKTQTQIIKAPNLKAGMVVQKHNARFLVKEDARSVSSLVGPANCVVADGECIEGVNPGYFHPGSAWTFQGNNLAVFCVEVQTVDSDATDLGDIGNGDQWEPVEDADAWKRADDLLIARRRHAR